MSETAVRRRSYSQLTTYQACGEQYRLKYVERHREEPAVWSAGGTAFHQVAEWYLGGDLAPEPTAGQLASAWEAAWDLAVNDLVLRGANPDVTTWRAANRGKENAAWWKGAGLQMVNDFVDWWLTRGGQLSVFSEGDRKYLEARLEVELAGVPMVAIPDAIVVDEHGQLNIMDYKSGKPPRESKQLGVYRAAFREATGLETTWGLYYMARAAQVIPIDLARHDPAAIADEFLAFHQAETAGLYPPKPGSHCKFCGVRDHCTYKEDA